MAQLECLLLAVERGQLTQSRGLLKGVPEVEIAGKT